MMGNNGDGNGEGDGDGDGEGEGEGGGNQRKHPFELVKTLHEGYMTRVCRMAHLIVQLLLPVKHVVLSLLKVHDTSITCQSQCQVPLYGH